LKGGRKEIRHTEVRIACSPTGSPFMLVREPDFCQYVFVVYLPSLCELDRYKPWLKGAPSPRQAVPADASKAAASTADEDDPYDV
jgi:hypothetical protein